MRLVSKMGPIERMTGDKIVGEDLEIEIAVRRVEVWTLLTSDCEECEAVVCVLIVYCGMPQLIIANVRHFNCSALALLLLGPK